MGCPVVDTWRGRGVSNNRHLGRKRGVSSVLGHPVRGGHHYHRTWNYFPMAHWFFRSCPRVEISGTHAAARVNSASCQENFSEGFWLDCFKLQLGSRWIELSWKWLHGDQP